MSEFLSAFLDGFLAVPRGILFLVRRPSLWPLCVAPLATATVVLLVLCGLSWWGWGSAMRVLLPEKSDWGWIYWPALIVGGLALSVMLAFLFTFVATLVAGPWLDRLSSGVEAEAKRESGVTGGIPDRHRPFSERLAGAAFVAAFLVVGSLLCLPLLCIPGIGAVLYAVVASPLGAAAIAWSFFDVPFGIHAYALRDRFPVLSRRWGAVFGLGAACLAAGFVPFLPLLLLPPATVGATLLLLRWLPPEKA